MLFNYYNKKLPLTRETIFTVILVYPHEFQLFLKNCNDR